MSYKTFSVKEALTFGWKTTISRLSFFVPLMLIIFGVALVPGILNSLFESENTLFSFFVSLLSWFIQLAVGIGTTVIALDIYRRRKPRLSSLYSHLDLFVPFFVGGLIYVGAVFIGSLLLLVPGVILYLKLQFFSYLVVDKKIGGVEAIKRSFHLTSGNEWRLFQLGFLLVVLNIFGVLFFFVGMIVTAPLSMLALVYVYEKLSSSSEK